MKSTVLGVGELKYTIGIFGLFLPIHVVAIAINAICSLKNSDSLFEFANPYRTCKNAYIYLQN